MAAEVFRRTLDRMRESGIQLSDLNIFNNEFASTICNYFLYLTICDLLEENEEFDLPLFRSKYQIPTDSILFLKENRHKIASIPKSMDLFKQIRLKSDKEFQLMQKCFIVYLGKDLEFGEVMNMREVFGIRRNLKRRNMAILIPNLYRTLSDI